MSSGKVASWAHGEEFVDEADLFADDGVLARARERGNELGAPPVLPGAGALMRLLAAAVQARSAVEIGTGSGVGSLYLLAGMHPDGVLTTIDPEVENQRAAREAFAEARIRTPRVRTIAGQPRDVVGRLTDHAYDLVAFPAHAPHAEELLEHARRLLRPGGVLVIPHALFHDRVADPAARDATTRAVRGLLRAVSEAEDLVPALTGSGDGVLAAVHRPRRG
ncbi:O-methyltransferase [Brachybacterium paraconglomeratum]|uniref:Methyltransferase domain-containing protein n=2 Tax=Brachybacterium TaxID=43668 RepID=A0A426SPJ1_9MICO|nr:MULTISPECIES: class I SAM-dependent methyltransferase [Brachybacterium]MCT1438598.1 class I SAM-dependent methyltransferase [Brachybacterium paraconglomeratum]MCT1910619.1 class I SAM-dependent methyltransferase [Brachybacterium paraconglomeratum]OFT63328.1 methyltransferase [Brachybacterium sp. HMSC06H03]RRR20063.1 methyltransferase domain-containing protein [Brachybacterium paraconglomeratum]TDP77063.1 putative O-methyltransferase YrrM [Brachybacterium sp. AG952]